MTEEMGAKMLVGEEVAKMAKNGDVIGVGTGSTVDAAITALAKRAKLEGLAFEVVTTSYESAWRCVELGLTVLDRMYLGDIPWGFDGADAVDAAGNAIKGKGGALLEEKILAKKCLRYALIVDESKQAVDVCRHCAIPVEVVPSARSIAERGLRGLGATEILPRDGMPGKYGPALTEHGNVLLDVRFAAFAPGLEARIKSLVGVVESGLFEGYADTVLVAHKGIVETIPMSKRVTNAVDGE
jgi:ribose 5-phosphate isomerase A